MSSSHELSWSRVLFGDLLGCLSRCNLGHMMLQAEHHNDDCTGSRSPDALQSSRESMAVDVCPPAAPGVLTLRPHLPPAPHPSSRHPSLLPAQLLQKPAGVKEARRRREPGGLQRSLPQCRCAARDSAATAPSTSLCGVVECVMLLQVWQALPQCSVKSLVSWERCMVIYIC